MIQHNQPASFLPVESHELDDQARLLTAFQEARDIPAGL